MSKSMRCDLRWIRKQVRGMRNPEPPQDLLGNLLDAIPKDARGETSPRPLPSRVGFPWCPSTVLPLAGLTGVVVISVAALMLLSRPSLTLAQVREVLSQQPWVHREYSNDDEWWFSLQDGKSFFRRSDGRTVFVNRALNIRHVYYPELHGEYIVEDEPATYKDGKVPAYEPMDAWDLVLGPYEGASKRDSDIQEYERHREVVDGKTLVRFDYYYTDALDRRLLMEQIWADPETRLPARSRRRLQLAEREGSDKEFVEAVYDFPDTGPGSIHDLGVPKGLKIVRQEEEWDLDVAQVLDAAKEARNRFPPSFRLVCWGSSSPVDIVYQDGAPVDGKHHADWRGVRIRKERYLNRGYHVTCRNTVDEVLEWSRGKVPVHVDVSDGTRAYTKRGPPPSTIASREEPSVRILRVSGPLGFNQSNWPRNYQWPYIRKGLKRVAPEKVDSASELLLFRRTAGGIRRDYRVDPTRDYICVEWAWWKERNGEWAKEREYLLSDLGQLPSGQWYARRRTLKTYADPEKGISGGGRIETNIDIAILDADEFPPDTFNGEKLLEGVDRVETY
jgi:hypothetical protein